MKFRLVTAAALVGGLALSLSGAEAATPTLDGKKVKSISVTATGSGQHDADQFTGLLDDAPDRTQCEDTRCSKTVFTYKPGRGVKGDLLFTATWPQGPSDIDLFVGVVGRDGTSTEIASCGAAAGTTEKVFIPASELKPGNKYVMVIDFYRASNVTVAGKVEINVPSTVKNTYPSDPIFGLPGDALNCGQ